jgi:purine-nucleoside phosphorylase
MSGDRFYVDEEDYLAKIKAYGALAVEMETSGLYTLAAKFGAAALTLSTVSDIIGCQQQLSSKARQQSMREMCEIALDTLAGNEI